MNSRVLIIEDDPVCMKLMEHIVGEMGHQVLSAIRGADGLAMAREHKPHLILCDLHLPDVDGCDVARELREDASMQAVPRVAVTSCNLPSDYAEAMEAGFNEYVVKPVHPIALRDLVTSLLR